MVKDFFIILALGLISLVLQSTWLSGAWVNPFRPDLIFILIIYWGTLNRLSLGLTLCVLLGMMVDVLSWGGLGLAMILYPLVQWVFSFIGTRTNIQSSAFSVIAVLVFQVIYGFLIHFYLTLSRGLDFSGNQPLLIIVQAFITTVVSIPVLYMLKTFLGKKPVLS